MVFSARSRRGDEYCAYYTQAPRVLADLRLQVPDEVLKKVYYKECIETVPGNRARAFPE